MVAVLAAASVAVSAVAVHRLTYLGYSAGVWAVASGCPGMRARIGSAAAAMSLGVPGPVVEPRELVALAAVAPGFGFAGTAAAAVLVAREKCQWETADAAAAAKLGLWQAQAAKTQAK